MNLYLDLFLTFAQIGACTFGGGYAMLPILQREVVEKRGWCSEEELADYFAIGQCTPGIIAVNTATFVGHKQKGTLGGIVATAGMVFPSLVIITVSPAYRQNFAHNPAVALIAASVLKLGKTTVTDGTSLSLFLAVLALAVLGNIAPLPTEGALGRFLGAVTSPVGLVVLAGAAGLLNRFVRGGRKG